MPVIIFQCASRRIPEDSSLSQIEMFILTDEAWNTSRRPTFFSVCVCVCVCVTVYTMDEQIPRQNFLKDLRHPNEGKLF